MFKTIPQKKTKKVQLETWRFYKHKKRLLELEEKDAKFRLMLPKKYRKKEKLELSEIPNDALLHKLTKEEEQER